MIATTTYTAEEYQEILDILSQAKNQNTVCIFDGPSLKNGVPVITLLTGFKTPSLNTKTADMLQSFIVLRDVSPTDAIASGQDEAVCGDCSLRPIVAKFLKLNSTISEAIVSCYVNVGRSVQAAWNSYKAGNVATITPRQASILISRLRQCPGICEATCKRDHIHKATRCSTRKACDNAGHSTGPLAYRMGSYGDPGLVPASIWEQLSQFLNSKHTSYTHNWQNADLSRSSMASLDRQTFPDVSASIELAKSRGYRWYRVLAEGEIKRADEILCPEAKPNSSVTCADCGLCSGTFKFKKARRLTGIVIPAIK